MRELVEHARSQGRRPRVHPNGFLQLDLADDGTRRLHIWHPDLPRQDVKTAIHDHIFDMVSFVHKGTLVQVELDFTLNHEGHPDHEIYMARYDGRSKSQLEPTGVLVARQHFDRYPVGEGEVYTQPAFTFHESVPGTEVVVTMMDKQSVHRGEPRVLVPVGQEPDNSFRREDADEQFLWKLIEENV